MTSARPSPLTSPAPATDHPALSLWVGAVDAKPVAADASSAARSIVSRVALPNTTYADPEWPLLSASRRRR